MTPNLEVLVNHVKRQDYYDNVYHLGVHNCRRIANSQTFSQHSWSNAVDIHVTSGAWTATPEEKAVGDLINADLEDAFGDHIRTLLWWRRDHWNHLHVDMWPYGYLTPPCAGGALRVKYANGHYTTGEPFPLTIEEDDELTPEQEAIIEWARRLKESYESVGSNHDAPRFFIPWYRDWASKYPHDFVTNVEVEANIDRG